MWAARSLRIRYAICIDGKPMTLAQGNELRRIASISTTILRLATSFNDVIESFLNYVQDFEENYAVSLVNAPVLDIVYDKMSSNFLIVSSKASYAGYIRVFETIIKNEGSFPLDLSFVMDPAVLMVKTMGITHLDDVGLCISAEETIFFMAQAANNL